MKVHEVKIYESYADAVLSGEKTFEIRFNDRGYQKGDRLKFRVTEDNSSIRATFHKLNEKEYEITYVHSGLGMADNYVALAIKALKETRDCKTCGHSNGGKCAGTEECHDCMWESKYIEADGETEEDGNPDIVNEQMDWHEMG